MSAWALGWALAPAAGWAATDPGVRGGAAGAGGPIAGLTANQQAFFDAGTDVFGEIDAVPNGLGPRFNLDSCAGCHAQPAVGGTAPALNPQVAVATRAGATNVLPPFITAGGPVREARFVRKPDGSPDGGVHALFVIAGRSDAPGCHIAQEDFAAQVAAGNVIFRIPSPTFGGGLVEGISDSDILAHMNSVNATNTVGIHGHENRSGNDGTLTRFGWKAQNKSLLIFAGEAYNVEQGVTNELFPNERDETPACQLNGLPESPTNFDATDVTGISSDAVQFQNFMRFLAPPAPAPNSFAPGIPDGRNKFNSIGCALCHTPSFTTGSNSVAALSHRPVNLFSDLVVHHMGPGLADGVSQGSAAGDEFRTAPLWGLGQRIFFLHDGRTTDLVQAIQAHKSLAANGYPDSEANAVVDAFNALNNAQQQHLLNFLRSL
jgi:CxxC motif-containing protein (DUF1111 family)